MLPDHVRVLADMGERAEEIDVARAQAALERAQKALEEPHVNVDPAAALAEMQRAQARLEAAPQAITSRSTIDRIRAVAQPG